MQNQVMISAMEDFKHCSDSSSEMNGKNINNLGCCSNEFQGIMAMEGGFDEDEEIINTTEETNCSKKKRLTIDQVRELEKIFEVDSKLDQDRKIKLAQELGLQPRQVAIWFQNRRARWKTKQLERDFRLLKANYESLQQNYTQIERENQGLVAQLRSLKEKLATEDQNNYNQTNCNIININNQRKDDLEQRVSSSSDHDQSATNLSNTGLIMNEDNSYSNNLNTKHPIMTSRLSSSSSSLSDDDYYYGLTTTVNLDHQSSAAFFSSLMDSSRGGGGEMMMKGYNYEQKQNILTGEDEEEDEFCNNMMMMMMPLPTDQTPLFWYFSDERN